MSEKSSAAQALRRNLVVSIVGGILLTAGIAIFTLASGSSTLLREELADRATSDVRALKLALADPLARGHLRTAGQLLREAADDPDLVAADVARTWWPPTWPVPTAGCSCRTARTPWAARPPPTTRRPQPPARRRASTTPRAATGCSS
jgi:hypothetical protein